MNRSMIVVLLFFLAGCQVYPYAEIGAGYNMEHEDFPDNNPTAHVSVGLEFSEGHVDRCELHHWSHYRYNGSDETYRTEVVCHWKIGGRPDE